jgi:hypothetical protein
MLQYSSTIKNSYALGLVQKPEGMTQTQALGGLVGLIDFDGNESNFQNNYFNSELNPGIDATYNLGDLFSARHTPFYNSTTELTSEQFADIQYYLDGTIEQVLADRELAAQQPTPQPPIDPSPVDPVPQVEEPVIQENGVATTLDQVTGGQRNTATQVFAGLTGSTVNFAFQPVSLETSLGDLAGSVESIGNSISQVLFSSSVGSVAADGVDFALGGDAANVGSGSGGGSGTSSSSQTTSFPAEAEPSSAGGTGASSQGDGISSGGESSDSSDNGEEEEAAI